MQKVSGFQAGISRNLREKCPILAKSSVLTGLEGHFQGTLLISAIDQNTSIVEMRALRSPFFKEKRTKATNKWRNWVGTVSCTPSVLATGHATNEMPCCDDLMLSTRKVTALIDPWTTTRRKPPSEGITRRKDAGDARTRIKEKQ